MYIAQHSNCNKGTTLHNAYQFQKQRQFESSKLNKTRSEPIAMGKNATNIIV